MSLLDNDFDISYIDIIRDLVLKYIKQDRIFSYVKLIDGFYVFKQGGELYKTDYDNNPVNWYIVYKPVQNEFYITKYPTIEGRRKNKVFIMRTSKCTPVTLEYILEQKY